MTSPRRSPRWSIVFALSLLYAAQGIPFGFATEYLPVALREQGYSYTGIAALGWLQLPWQLKILWAKAADSPRLRARTRGIILALQLALSVVVAAFAFRPLSQAPTLWFVLTAAAATVAATQDVFVDALSVRVLSPSERGLGNTAQVAGYRLGMLVGGAALLLLVGHFGERETLLGCAALVTLASVGAFAELRADSSSALDATSAERTDNVVTEDGAGTTNPSSVLELVRHMLGRKTIIVLVIALTFKLGLHMASSLLKPMAKDFGWTKEQIGWAMVSVGSVSALAGAAAGGALHRWVSERRALVMAVVIQTLTVLPLVAIARLHAPLAFTTFTIALEHFGSGLGTTVLFAALMSATRPRDAGLHYTILTSANTIAIGVGSVIGGVLADRAGLVFTIVAATIVTALPVLLLGRWESSAHASSAIAKS